MTKKLRISVALMILTIIVITVFQAYWLRKNFKEEKELFSIRTNVLFRETIFAIQASKLNFDTSFAIRMNNKPGVISMTNQIRYSYSDSTGGRRSSGSSLIIAARPTQAMLTDSVPDSARRILIRRPNANVRDFLVSIDSLQAPITTKDVSKEFQQRLEKENLFLPFIVTSKAVARHADRLHPLPDAQDNKVTVGFSKPVTFELTFANTTWYLMKKLWQPAIVSLLLVGVTVISFLLLYRNLIRQRRLTELKNDFISNITHELKTPIATVSVAIEALKNFNAIDDPKRTTEYLDISANELQRLSLLVDKVLKLSMFEKQQIDVKKEPFDLLDLAKEIIASMRLQFEKYHAKISIDTDGNNFMLNGDKMHVTSVLFNLLDNALKYSKANPSVQVLVSGNPDSVAVSVTDNGTGIPAAYKNRVFEKFFRVPSGDRHNVKGYGLGLSYVSFIVQRHNGSIEVDSQEGIGSRFTVKLPRS